PQNSNQSVSHSQQQQQPFNPPGLNQQVTHSSIVAPGTYTIANTNAVIHFPNQAIIHTILPTNGNSSYLQPPAPQANQSRRQIFQNQQTHQHQTALRNRKKWSTKELDKELEQIQQQLVLQEKTPLPPFEKDVGQLSSTEKLKLEHQKFQQ